VLRVYRVLPYLSTAKSAESGHPLFVPPSIGANRIDNPELYDSFYVGDTAAGAVAEAFGYAARWNTGLLRGTPSLPGSVRALATYELSDPAAVCDLDDAGRLLEYGLRPSRVVTRDRAVSQNWARVIFEQRRYAGVRWWSYYSADWGSIGLWSTSDLVVADVQALTLEHPALVSAAAAIVRLVG